MRRDSRAALRKHGVRWCFCGFGIPVCQDVRPATWPCLGNRHPYPYPYSTFLMEDHMGSAAVYWSRAYCTVVSESSTQVEMVRCRHCVLSTRSHAGSICERLCTLCARSTSASRNHTAITSCLHRSSRSSFVFLQLRWRRGIECPVARPYTVR